MRHSRSAIEIGLLLFGNGLAGLLLLISALLRETPDFWRNHGGYPILLRALVFYLHYPLFLLVLMGTVLATLASLRFYVGNRGTGGGLLLASGLQWILLLAVLTIMLWNNAENLMDGHPLHYHNPVR
jgi:hypothetical protein